MKVKLIGAIRRVEGVFHEFGAVVDVPDELAERMLAGGAAVGPNDEVPVPSGGDVYDLPSEDDVDLDSLKVPELKALAAERGVDLGDASKKDDIIAALEAAE